MSKFLFLLPPEVTTDIAFEDILLTATEVFGDIDPCVIAAPRSTISHFQSLLPGVTIQVYEDLGDPLPFSHVVLIRTNDGQAEFSALSKLQPDTRLFFRRAMVDELFQENLQETRLDADPTGLSHYFDRAAYCQPTGFHYFPYGYTYRLPGLGPMNELGFRINFDFLSLKNRPSNHKVVVFFGGSACWSIYVTYQRMFQQRLEDKLKAEIESAGHDIKITVLNFGHPGNVVLNEMISYMLYVQAINPDIVVGHDGCNDLICGQADDTFLVRQHSIVYPDLQEDWAQMLHAPKEPVPLSFGSADAIEVNNYPRDAVGAYLFRQQQFCQMVRGFGGKFFAALQPLIYSRVYKHPLEEVAMTGYNPRYQVTYRGLPYLYQKYVEHVDSASFDYFLDFHALFGEITDTDNMYLGDVMHTTALGDEFMADVYKDYFVKHIIPKWVGGGDA